MIYATLDAARIAAQSLNRQHGYDPARVYYRAAGGFTVVRSWKRCDHATSSLTLVWEA